ncbi:MAG TPA: SpoIID/LytB domain-containing protein [Actinomycetota bacterium]|nr:SpoIID/LytB domain-containing protein [Actinomycetota bacterium]
MKTLMPRHCLLRPIALLAAAAALVGGLSAGPARAQQTVTITGGGWGHGIGMSQYGAYGRALKGAGATRILEHYYSGGKVTTEPMPGRLRVGLIQYKAALTATGLPGTGDGTVTFKLPGSKAPISSGPGGTKWKVEASSTGGFRLYKNGKPVEEDGVSVFGSPEVPLVLLYEKHGSLVDIAEKPYDYAYGRLEFGSFATDRCPEGYCLRLVVSLSMQKYLYGLGEVPASWPAAALKAQAIAARTYAYDKTIRSGQHRHPCDCAVFDSTYDQAYIGDAKRSGSGEYWDDWKAAVDDTREQVVMYRGAPVQALYSSSSGGHTEDNENVWGGTALPYLRGVDDDADAVEANPNHTWTVEMPFSTFENKLDAAFGIGRLRDFRLVAPFGVSGRVTVVKDDGRGGVLIEGSKKTVRVSGWSIRAALGLKDTLFRVELGGPGVDELLVPKYESLDGAPGSPSGDAYPVPRDGDRLGIAQDFERGRIAWRDATEKAVWQKGPVLRAYDRIGREGSALGMPTSDLWGDGYRGASYVNGVMLWSSDTGAHPVTGGFFAAFRAAGGASGPLGLPLDRRGTSDSVPGGRVQRFQQGAIYKSPAPARIVALWGEIAARYVELGEAAGPCGYPLESMDPASERVEAIFEKGTISWSESGGTEVRCSGE